MAQGGAATAHPTAPAHQPRPPPARSGRGTMAYPPTESTVCYGNAVSSLARSEAGRQGFQRATAGRPADDCRGPRGRVTRRETIVGGLIDHIERRLRGARAVPPRYRADRAFEAASPGEAALEQERAGGGEDGSRPRRPRQGSCQQRRPPTMDIQRPTTRYWVKDRPCAAAALLDCNPLETMATRAGSARYDKGPGGCRRGSL